jgi:hypothetical protein
LPHSSFGVTTGRRRVLNSSRTTVGSRRSAVQSPFAIGSDGRRSAATSRSSPPVARERTSNVHSPSPGTSSVRRPHCRTATGAASVGRVSPTVVGGQSASRSGGTVAATPSTVDVSPQPASSRPATLAIAAPTNAFMALGRDDPASGSAPPPESG